MAERITVALSDETANLLNLYCDKRQMNKSSASAGLLVDGLENWLMHQRDIGKKMTEAKTQSHFDFSILARNRDLSNAKLNAELRLALSHLTISNDIDENKKLLSLNLMVAIHHLCNRIVPIKSFANDTYERLCTALYARLASSEIAQKIYVDGLSLADKKDVDEQLRRIVPFDFNTAKDYKVSITTYEQLGVLVPWTNVNVDISQNIYEDIQAFFKEHVNGKIIVIGEIGTGKTTFSTELAQLFHCDLVDDELGEELRSNNIIDFFNSDNRTVGTSVGKNTSMVISRMTKKIKSEVEENDNADIRKDKRIQDIYFVKVVREETNQFHGLQPIFKRYIESGNVKRVELVGNEK